MKQSQASRLLALLKDGQPHSTPEILRVVYNLHDDKGIARIGARIFDLKAKGHEISGWNDKENPAIHWYVLGNPPKPKPKLVPKMVMVDGVEIVRFVPQ